MPTSVIALGTMAPSLTFAISSSESSTTLSRLLASIAGQTYSENVSVLIARRRPGENLSSLRNRLYLQSTSSWVYFVDDDCELPDSQFLERLLRYLEQPGIPDCLGGRYLGGRGLWQRAYNRLANAWLETHSAAGHGLPIAGNFALAKISGADLEFPFCSHSPFGGEELALAKNLQSRNLTFSLSPHLSLVHDSSRSARVFFQRAWQHGRAPHLRLRPFQGLRAFLKPIIETRDVCLCLCMFAYMTTVIISRKFRSSVQDG